MLKFELNKTQNFLDHIENEAQDYCKDAIIYHYKVNDLENLSREQIVEVAEHIEKNDNQYAEIIMQGLRNCVELWEDEHDEDAYGC